jgi:hypothetical protein
MILFSTATMTITLIVIMNLKTDIYIFMIYPHIRTTVAQKLIEFLLYHCII